MRGGEDCNVGTVMAVKVRGSAQATTHSLWKAVKRKR